MAYCVAICRQSQPVVQLIDNMCSSYTGGWLHSTVRTTDDLGAKRIQEHVPTFDLRSLKATAELRNFKFHHMEEEGGESRRPVC